MSKKMIDINVKVPESQLLVAAQGVADRLSIFFSIKVRAKDLLARPDFQVAVKVWIQERLDHNAKNFGAHDFSYDCAFDCNAEFNLEKVFATEIAAEVLKRSKLEDALEAKALALRLKRPVTLTVEVPRAQEQKVLAMLKAEGFYPQSS